MKIRKINSICSLLTMDFLYLHLVCLSIAMIINKLDVRFFSITGRILSCFFLVHMILSFILLIFKNENKKIQYKQYNYKTIIQRITAIWMIIFLVFHIAICKTFEGVQSESIGVRLLVFFGEAIFFSITLIHITISAPKAQFGFGKIDTEEKFAKQEKIELVKNLVLGIFSIVSLAIYCFGGLL